jgi:uncharacterized protein (TIGR00290 family)
MGPEALLSWSTGKDSAFALYEARRLGLAQVVGLVTTVTRTFSRVSMHGVREELLDAQAAALALTCHKIEIPSPCTNADYERLLLATLEPLRSPRLRHLVFGDLFLTDIRAYRDRLLEPRGFVNLYPLWERDTVQLAKDMLDLGLQARITCVDPAKLDRSFAGRSFDTAFLADLPAGVDPCGENGEFHTFVHAGPDFAIPITVGEIVERDGFIFADLQRA